MKSIDRLREFMTYKDNGKPHYRGSLEGMNIIRAGLDAIESEAKANRVDAYTKGYDEGFASADDWAAQHENAMAEHGWVRLPVDAEGEPIHVGDVMEWPDCSTAEVVGIGNDTFFYVEDGEDAAEWSCASDKIHHRAPTVEDVLREFADELWNSYCIGGTASDSGVRELEAKYVARLRLAGDE